MGLPVQQNELRSVTVAARVQLANRPVWLFSLILSHSKRFYRELSAR